MFFNSVDFAIFFPIVFVIYWLAFSNSLRIQNLFIVVVSYIFYAWWDWRFLSLIIISSTIDYIIGIKLNRTTNNIHKKIFLCISLFANLGLLAFFKYYNFFINSFLSAFSSIGIHLTQNTLKIILPVGISFYTFQTMSYTIDIFRKKIKPTGDLIAFFAFVSFFPQLVAGPIERASNLLPQFTKKRYFHYDTALVGLNLIIYGLFKKIVVADRLAIYVNEVFSDLPNANTISISIAVIFFSFQIYCDFSGYSDIARGTAKLLGFDLMVNFNKPYLSKSVSEFWKRWHISLSSWFKDYLYIPLGGSRVNKTKRIRNILIVFVVSGLWHGANWTFVLWGALHGLYLSCSIIFEKYTSRFSEFRSGKKLEGIITILNIIITYLLVAFAWIFFRAEDVAQAFYIIKKIFSFNFSLNWFVIFANRGPINFLISLFAIGMLLLSYKIPFNLQKIGYRRNIALIVGALFIIVTLGEFKSAEFIYFQF